MNTIAKLIIVGLVVGLVMSAMAIKCGRSIKKYQDSRLIEVAPNLYVAPNCLNNYPEVLQAIK